MSLHTSNSYGEITITEDAVASVAGRLAMDCYGVVDKVPRNFSDACADMFKRNSLSRGVKVITKDNRIFVDLYVILSFGLNIKAVADSLKSTIKYGLESFTGMIVDTVNVHVVGIRL
jgi:uncharacterized alkaline shock family protein YloU